MQGASRAALRVGGDLLRAQLDTGIPGRELGEQLFASASAVAGSVTLRRALTDPSRAGEARAEVARRLFGGKVSDQAAALVAGLAGQRWSSEHDLVDALEQLAVRAVLANAAREQRLDQVEDELFRFERIVAADAGLRDAVTDRNGDPGAKGDLVGKLLDGKAAPETVQLARQAVTGARGRRFDRIIDRYLTVSSQARDEASAIVQVAIPLQDDQRARLGAALARIYGRPVHVNVVVDPAVLGGIRVQVGDEVIDGTMSRKLEDARRRLTGAP